VQALCLAQDKELSIYLAMYSLALSLLKGLWSPYFHSYLSGKICPLHIFYVEIIYWC
jgi:hypothetical protein